LFNDISDNEEIWKIFKFNKQIYFQSFNQLFVFKNNSIKKIKIPFQISYCFVVENQIYLASVRDGIFLMNGNRFQKIKNWTGLENNIIHGIEKNNNKTYIFTQKNGVFIDYNSKFSAWNNPLNEVLKKEIIITAKFLNNNKLAIGTAFRGLYIIDFNNNSYSNISRNNALKNNSVLSICLDKEKDLWLGLDNGIAHIETNSPYQIFADNSGILGSVYSLVNTENGYLIGSNHGVFKYENKKLTLLPNTQGQVWDIQKINQKYIIGHNEGTFEYKSSLISKINNINGGWELLKSNFQNVYFQANYSGIAVYYDENDFSKFKRFEGINKPIRYIAQNKPNEIWAADNYRSLFKVEFNNDFVVTKIENVSKSNDLKNDFGIKIFNFKNEILFLINSVWYNFNAITNKLEKNIVFNKSFKGTSEIISIDNQSFIATKDGLLFLINQVEGNFIWQLIPEKYYEGKIINHDTKVMLIDNKLYINLDDGFFVYEIRKPKIGIEKIIVEAVYQNKIITENTYIQFNNSLEINVLSEFYGHNRSNLFYKFNNSKDLVPINKGIVFLNNLESGKQKLEIYINNGKQYIKVANYNFKVEQPWYFSIWMILIYIVVISGIFFLYYRWNKIRYIQKSERKEEDLKHQNAILKLESDVENKLKLQEYEKHILELQVQTKASEVAGKSLSIVKQTELIDSIQIILETEMEVNQIKNKIKKSIKINAINKNEWQSFENNLMKSNEEFVQKLIAKYPNLSSKDVKLCIYLKMNLSSKEIAPLMNISFRSVELYRYRLRKKISLNQEDSLYKLMINL
ncbi:MAG: histidine kinase, partial [Flavobacterium sp.]|nr:histidine kinase [Flavobacterium sp.]